MQRRIIGLALAWLGVAGAVQAQNGLLTGTAIRTGTYTGHSLQASEEVELQAEVNGQPGFSVSAEGFAATIARPPAQVGIWGAPFAWGGTDLPRELSVAIHTHVLPDGKVLSWQGHNDDHFATMRMGTDTYRWSPQSLAAIGPTFHLSWTNAFCTGHSFLADGRLLVTGGHDRNVEDPNDIYPDYIKGLEHASTYDYSVPAVVTPTNRAPGWQKVADMARYRWYPTNTTLSNGNVLTTAGETEPIPLLPLSARWPELWSNGAWTKLTSAPKELPLYPWVFATANGNAFYAGPGTDLSYISTSGTGAWTAASGQTRAYGQRLQGTAAMFAPGQILVVGGCDNTSVTNTAEIIDLSSGPLMAGTSYRQPVVTPAAPMRFPRHHANSTLLPDGTVLVTGGTRATIFSDRSMAVLEPELWNPPPPYGSGATPGGTWTTLAPMAEARMYHSTAVLLPDGRVLSAGGEEVTYPFVPNVNNHCTAELFSPPYLAQPGGRPSITYAPVSVSYGNDFAFNTPTPNDIDAVTWIRLSSVTHSFNMNQRFARLPITGRSATSVTATAPASPDDCPPGHYLLFALRNGVPSEGQIVSISNNPCAATLDLATSVEAYTCGATAQATVSGTNLSAGIRWRIDGTYEPAFDGQTTVSVALHACWPQVSFAVEVVPACGTVPLTASESVSGGPFSHNGYSCLCE